MSTILHLRKIFSSSRDHISQTDALNFYKIVDMIARAHIQVVMHRRISLGHYFEARFSLFAHSSSISKWAAHRAYIYNFAPPFHLIKVNWEFLNFEALNSTKDGSWHREQIQFSTTTQLSFRSDNIPAETWASLAFQHLPTVLNSLRELLRPDFRNDGFSWVYEHPEEVILKIQIEFLHSNCPTLPLYLFACPQLTASTKQCYEAPDLFYFSFDPLGQNRLKEHDLYRLELVVTSTFLLQTRRKTLASFAVDAISEVMKLCDAPAPNSPQCTLHEPTPRVARCSSVDRFIEYPRPWHVRYDHHHIESTPQHEAICSLVCRVDDCICQEVKIQQAGVDLDVSDYPFYPKTGHCPCDDQDSPARRKRRKAKSLDRADWIGKAVSKWISLLAATGMDSRDLHDWYVDPSW
ncbi:hypothetical protein DL96DRAFT_659250 [Flagelloscypha sp. PMI_526]|nr:hypothetical protein DL96DRAFT_659250 [Flagelloscypha sp. PMI_526]